MKVKILNESLGHLDETEKQALYYFKEIFENDPRGINF